MAFVVGRDGQAGHTGEVILGGVKMANMNTTEAIEWFKASAKHGYCVEGENCPQCNAERLALEALEEKQEREQGCEYCNETVTRPSRILKIGRAHV